MTDEIKTPQSADDRQGRPVEYDFSSDPDGLTKEDFNTGEDAFMSLLLAIVPGEEDRDSSIGITLSVKGTVIAGKAVSFAHWSKLWAAEMTRNHEAMGDAVGRGLESWVKERADFRARREAENRPVPDPLNLCLKDAQFVQGPARYHAGLMRIRRDRIDAWSLGEPMG